jgi:hypothetical protein
MTETLTKDEVLDLYHSVFNNFQNRNSFIDVMKIAFKAGNNNGDFDRWLADAKREVEIKIEEI